MSPSVRLLSACMVFGMLFVSGCSSDKGTDNNGGGGGGGGSREFVSGNLANGQSFEHVFDSAGVYPYYCRFHGDSGGVGMSGVITVNPGGTPSKEQYNITTNTTLPSDVIDVGDTARWTNNTAMTHTVESDF